MAEKIPVKLFYRIGEVASILKVESHTLRYWEQQFSVIRPRKSSNGHRVYRRVDVERLEMLRDLLYREGYTIAGVKKRIKEEGVEFFAPQLPQKESKAALEPRSVVKETFVATTSTESSSLSPNKELLGKLSSLRDQMEQDLVALQEDKD